MTRVRITLTALIVAMMTLLTGCIYDETPDVHPYGDGNVRLVLNVGINNPAATRGGSRASYDYPAGQYPDGYDYGFEPAVTQYEGIHTLRAIIVDAGKKVEGNQMITFSPKAPSSSEDLYGDLVFAVKGGETKRVYLIANEAATGIDFTQYALGMSLQDDDMAALTMTSAASAPFIDNESAAEADKKYLPMSEFFDVQIKENTTEETLEQKQTLFVTRVCTKFSFEVKGYQKTNDSGAVVTPPTQDSFRIRSITVSGLTDKEYLFPNATTYSSDKYTGLDAASIQKIITGYSIPDALQPFSYTFTPANFGYTYGKTTVDSGDSETDEGVEEGDEIEEGEESSEEEVGFRARRAPGDAAFVDHDSFWAPQLYFFESFPTGKYHVSIKLEFDGETQVKKDENGKEILDGNGEPVMEPVLHTYEADLPNLPPPAALPRNTFVKVEFRFIGRQLQCEVILMPYIGVWLNPDFGLEVK